MPGCGRRTRTSSLSPGRPGYTSGPTAHPTPGDGPPLGGSWSCGGLGSPLGLIFCLEHGDRAQSSSRGLSESCGPCPGGPLGSRPGGWASLCAGPNRDTEADGRPPRHVPACVMCLHTCACVCRVHTCDDHFRLLQLRTAGVDSEARLAPVLAPRRPLGSRPSVPTCVCPSSGSRHWYPGASSSFGT